MILPITALIVSILVLAYCIHTNIMVTKTREDCNRILDNTLQQYDRLIKEAKIGDNLATKIKVEMKKKEEK